MVLFISFRRAQPRSSGLAKNMPAQGKKKLALKKAKPNLPVFTLPSAKLPLKLPPQALARLKEQGVKSGLIEVHFHSEKTGIGFYGVYDAATGRLVESADFRVF